MAELAIADEALLDKLLNPPSEDRQPIRFIREVGPSLRLPRSSTPLSLLKEQLDKFDVTEASFISAARL